MNIRNFTILGGGISACLTALRLKKIFPKIPISVLNENISDTLVNENSGSPTLVNFLKSNDVDIKKFFRETNATIKIGNQFYDWNQLIYGDRKTFRQTFNTNWFDINEILWPDKEETDQEVDPETGEPLQHEYDSNKAKEAKDFGLAMQRAYLNHLSVDEDTFESYSIIETDKFSAIGIEDENFKYGLHYDPILCINFLKNWVINLGVELIETTIDDLIFDDEKNLIAIKTTHEEYACDIVFDCTDAMRLAISQYDDYLFTSINYINQNAIWSGVSNLFNEENWTTHQALDFGWAMLTPLQNKTLINYYFDDRFADYSLIKEEIKEKFKIEPLEEKELAFDGGYVEKTWSANVIAIGPSAAFLEPLGFNNVDFILFQLSLFEKIVKEALTYSYTIDTDISLLENLDLDSEIFLLKQLEWNELVGNQARELADYSLIHYYSKRRDTDYWEYKKDLFTFRSSIEEKAAELDGFHETATYKMMLWKENPVYYQAENNNYSILNEYNFLSLFAGIELYDITERKEKIKDNAVLQFCTDEQYIELKNLFLQQKEKANEYSMNQKEYIEYHELTFNSTKN